MNQSDIYATMHNDRYDEQQGKDVAIYRGEVRRLLDEAAKRFEGMRVTREQGLIYWSAIAEIPCYCPWTLEAAGKELKQWVNV